MYSMFGVTTCYESLRNSRVNPEISHSGEHVNSKCMPWQVRSLCFCAHLLGNIEDKMDVQ